VCDFSRTNEESDLFLSPDLFFGIPRSQFNLLTLASIRGTDIVPAYRFETEYGDVSDSDPFNPEDPQNGCGTYQVSGLTLRPINGFWLRSPVVSTADAEGMWWAHVWAMSKDMNGVDRQY